MPFTLTCKCPGCDQVTSHCTDTSLVKDRVEYDSVRCKQCQPNPERMRTYQTRLYLMNSKNKQARYQKWS